MPAHDCDVRRYAGSVTQEVHKWKRPHRYKTRGALSLLVGPVGLEPTTKGL